MTDHNLHMTSITSGQLIKKSLHAMAPFNWEFKSSVPFQGTPGNF